MSRFLILALIALFSFSCGNSQKDCCKTVTNDAASHTKQPLTIDAKYVSAGAIEGEADLTFEKENGEKIVFYRNYFDKSEPELSYMLIGDDGTSANKELVGKKFKITYKDKPKGRISMQNGDSVACKQILKLEKLN